jgi:hypothetical protein
VDYEQFPGGLLRQGCCRAGACRSPPPAAQPFLGTRALRCSACTFKSTANVVCCRQADAWTQVDRGASEMCNCSRVQPAVPVDPGSSDLAHGRTVIMDMTSLLVLKLFMVIRCMQPKTYVAGSRADDGSSTGTLVAAAGAAALAVALLVVGLTANNSNVPVGALPKVVLLSCLTCIEAVLCARQAALNLYILRPGNCLAAGEFTEALVYALRFP